MLTFESVSLFHFEYLTFTKSSCKLWPEVCQKAFKITATDTDHLQGILKANLKSSNGDALSLLDRSRKPAMLKRAWPFPVFWLFLSFFFLPGLSHVGSGYKLV